MKFLSRVLRHSEMTSELKVMRFWSWLLLGALAVSLIGMNEARAAIVAAGATCSASSGTSGTTLPCTVATEAFDVNNVAVLWFAGDDAATADTVDHNNLLLTSVTDNAPTPNIWTVQRCFTNVQATAAANGATVCVATARITSAIPIGGTITATFGTTAAKAIVVREFTVAAGNALDIAGTATDLANDGADPGSMTISSLTSGEYLFVRATASERDVITWTSTTNYTPSNCATTTGGGAAANMNICGEFRILTGTGDTSDPTGTNVDNASIFIAFKEKASTTIATGSDPGATTVSPDSGAQTAYDVNYFTLLTSSGTESITSVTVNLSTNAGIARLAITDNGNTELGFTTSPATGSNTISVTSMSASTSLATFKVRITPLHHTAMPAPLGGLYNITAPVTAWAGPNAHVGSDTNPSALTIDNQSSSDVTGSPTGTAGDGVINLSGWTVPADANFVIVVRDETAVVTPTEGNTLYSTTPPDNVIGTSTVVCSGAAITTCADNTVTNGTTYSYKIYTRDSIGNYSVGVTPAGSPYTPAGPGCYSVATGNWSANSTWASAAGGTPGTCPGSGNVPDSSTPAYINFTTTSHTVTVDITTAAATLVRIGAPGTGTAGLAIAAGTLDVGSSVTLVGGTGTKKALLSFTTGTLKVGGTITESGATDVTFGTGTVEYDGTGAQSVATYNYYNLTINKASGTATTSGNITIGNNLTITTGTLNIAANSINRGAAGGTFTLGSGALLQIAAANLPANYNTVNIATTSTVEYNPSFNAIVPAPGGGANYGNLLLSNSGNRTFNAAMTIAGNLTATGTVALSMNAGITVNGNFNLGSGTSMDAKTFSHTVKGNFTNNGTFTPSTSTFTFDGTSAAQTIGDGATSFYNFVASNSLGVTTNVDLSISGNFTNTVGFSAGSTTTTFNGTAAQTITGATTFYNLILNNTNAAGLTINNDVTVGNPSTGGTLTFSNGRITTGTNTLILSSTSSCGVSGAGSGKYVIGKLRKRFVPTTQIACNFEVGDSSATTHYTPLNVSFAAVSAAGSLTVKASGGTGANATADDHPQVIDGTAALDSANSINRYWMLVPADGLTFSNATLTFTHLDDATWLDHDNSTANVGRYIVKQLTMSNANCYTGEVGYTGAGSWSTATASGTQTVTQTAVTGVSSFGTNCSHFMIGRSTISSFLREREFIFQREINY